MNPKPILNLNTTTVVTQALRGQVLLPPVAHTMPVSVATT
jgi:hypothetical protein